MFQNLQKGGGGGGGEGVKDNIMQGKKMILNCKKLSKKKKDPGISF